MRSPNVNVNLPVRDPVWDGIYGGKSSSTVDVVPMFSSLLLTSLKPFISMVVMRLQLSPISLLLASYTAALVASVPHRSQAVTCIPPDPANASSIVQFNSTGSGLDGPHVSPINATTWDWWYFDAVAEDQSNQVVVVFYTGQPPIGSSPNELPVQLLIGIPGSPILPPNGSVSAEALASQAEITTIGQGASGKWDGTGFSFKGEPDLRRYVIEVDAPSIVPNGGIKGSITFESVS
jgi:hypothetical protein